MARKANPKAQGELGPDIRVEQVSHADAHSGSGNPSKTWSESRSNQRQGWQLQYAALMAVTSSSWVVADLQLLLEVGEMAGAEAT